MSKEEIKKKIHELIDCIDDETALQMLYEDAVEYTTSSETRDDNLTDEQWASIKKGMQQIENAEYYTHEEVMEKIKAWRSTK